MSRTRLNVFLEFEHAKQLAQFAHLKGLSKSSVVAAALVSFLSPDGADKREAAIGRRLDRLSRQFERIERDQTILIETTALYVRYFLSVSTPVAEEHLEAVRAQGLVRFSKFIEQLAKHLQRGHSLVKDVYEEVFPEAKGFFDSAQDTPARESEEMP